MATAIMTKVKIAIASENQKTVLDLLTRSGSFEVCEADKSMPELFESTRNLDDVKHRQQKVANAIDTLYKFNEDAYATNLALKKTPRKLRNSLPIEGVDQKSAKKGPSPLLINISKNDYEFLRKNESAILALCDNLEDKAQELINVEAKIQSLLDKNSLLAPYTNVTVPFSSFKDTKTTSVILALGPNDVNKSSIESLNCFVEEFTSSHGAVWGVLCNINDKPLIESKLSLLGFSLFETSKAKEEMPDIFESTSNLDDIKQKQQKVANAISSFLKLNNEAAKQDSSTPLINFSKDDYKVLRKNESAMLTFCNELEEKILELQNIDIEIQNLLDKNSLLAPYINVTIPLNKFNDAKTASVILAFGPSKANKISIERLDCFVEEFSSSDGAVWGVVCDFKDKPAVERKLGLLGFTIFNLSYDKTAADLIEENKVKIEGLQQERFAVYTKTLDFFGRLNELKSLNDSYTLDIEYAAIKKSFLLEGDKVTYNLNYDKTAAGLIEENKVKIESLQQQRFATHAKGLDFLSRLNELKFLHDSYALDIEYAEIEKNFLFDGDTVTIEGWTPEAYSLKIKDKILETVTDAKVVIRPPETDEEPPTLIANRRLFRPFEGITKGYSAPRYGEADPSAIMSIFFFIFFGIMLADAGYGLIMAIAGFVAGIVIKKLQAPTRRLIFMFAICGISGVIFGILFGSVFAIEGIPTIPVIGFSPLEEPITMLIFSIALGAVHLLTGYTLKTIAAIRMNVIMVKGLSAGAKVRRIFDAIFYSLFMYTLFIGIVMIALPMVPFFGDMNFPFATMGLILLAVTGAGLLLTGGRNAKSIGGRISGGLGSLYRIINIFSDLLSYARLFGLALASAAIGMAFNQIGMLLFALPIVGYVIGGIILVVLHLLNLVLAALAAYVHTIRLEYVEFFGKFYEGGGRDFLPLGDNLKYVKFVEHVST